MSFVKLHGSILDSSIWAEPVDVRIVWVTMLAMADEHGVVEASVGGLARRAVVSLDACRAALKVLTSPDPDSRDGSTGERIEKVPGGWFIINHANYRDKRTRQQVLTAARVAKHRAKRNSDTRNDVTPGNGRNGKPPPEAEAEAEADQPPNGGRARKPRRARIAPQSFEPSDAHRKLASELGVNIEAECRKFKDWEFKDPKSDWSRAFFRWIRTAKEMGSNGTSRKPEPKQPNSGYRSPTTRFL
jgi:hypothetical protein